MSELKSTPPPWNVQHDELVAEKGPTVAIFLCCGNQETNAANAHLAAAAPELYDALNAIVKCWDGPLYRHEMLPNIEKARAALARARGES